MPTTPPAYLLDRDLSRAALQKHIEVADPLLTEVVNYGVAPLRRCIDALKHGAQPRDPPATSPSLGDDRISSLSLVPRARRGFFCGQPFEGSRSLRRTEAGWVRGQGRSRVRPIASSPSAPAPAAAHS